jgi:hypothetical protein
MILEDYLFRNGDRRPTDKKQQPASCPADRKARIISKRINCSLHPMLRGVAG